MFYSQCFTRSCPVSSAPLVKELSFPLVYSFLLCHRLIAQQCLSFCDYCSSCQNLLFDGRIIFNCTCIPLFIHSSVDGHLRCFSLLALVDATVNMAIQISLQDSAFRSSGYMPSSGVAGSMVIPFSAV